MCDPADLEILGDAECRGCGHIGDHAVGCAYAEFDPYSSCTIFTPVSERLRLHYCEGAHAGLRGDWARAIRDETALQRASARNFRRASRLMAEGRGRTWQKPTPNEQLEAILAFVRDLTDEQFSLLAQERGYFLVIPDQEEPF